MNLNKKHSKVRAVGLSSSFALLALLGLAVFCPSIDNNASAAEGDSATFVLDFILDKDNFRSALAQAAQSGSNEVINMTYGNDVAVQAADDINRSATFVVDFLLSPKISVTMSDFSAKSTQDVQQVSGNTKTITQYVDFSASTNSTNGVGVFVYSADTNANLTAAGTSDVIETIANGDSGKSVSAITTNRWGYNLSTDVTTNNMNSRGLRPMPLNSSAPAPVAAPTVNNNSASYNYRLTFGAKVDYMSMTPGDYSKTVNVHVVPSANDTMVTNAVAEVLETANI